MVLDGAKGEKREANPETAKTKEYEQFDLNNDMGKGDKWTGEPYLTDVYPSDYGRSALLYIANHENKERLKGRVKVKSETDEVSFWEGSLGYDIIRSIKELNGESYDGLNVITIPFSELQEYINGLDEITVEVINRTAEIKGEVRNWNTLKLIKIGG